MDILLAGFSSTNLIKASIHSDKIVECVDFNKIDNHVEDQEKKVLLIDISNESNVSKVKLDNFAKNLKRNLKTKIVIIGDENSIIIPYYGSICLKKSKNENSEECVVSFEKKIREVLHSIVGNSSHVKAIRSKIFDMLFSDPHVLILGETGTGKNLLASVIHGVSVRKGKLISLNLTTLPESLLESELFGHTKGAYTGADSAREGLVGQADNGHFFLDEIGELSIDIQTKLLNVIEDGKYYVVGGSGTKPVDVKFISATNRETTYVRSDLLFRLSEETIELLPLRNRKDDIPELVNYFLTNLDYENKFSDLSPDIQAKLISYDYPGNIRELQNILKRYLSSGTLDLPTHKDNTMKLPHSIIDKSNAYRVIENSLDELVDKMIKDNDFLPIIDLKDKIASKFEAEYVNRVLRTFKWDKQKTADKLGISYRYLNKLILKHSMDRRTKKSED